MLNFFGIPTRYDFSRASERVLQARWEKAVERLRDEVPPAVNLDGTPNEAGAYFLRILLEGREGRNEYSRH